MLYSLKNDKARDFYEIAPFRVGELILGYKLEEEIIYR